MTVDGNGDNQRSGLKSKASAPQISLHRFAERSPRTIGVPAGTVIFSKGDPSLQMMGSDRGSIVSRDALHRSVLLK